MLPLAGIVVIILVIINCQGQGAGLMDHGGRGYDILGPRLEGVIAGIGYAPWTRTRMR